MQVIREARLTTHVHCIGEEVAGICDQEDEAALNLRVSSDMGEFQEQARSNANAQSDEYTTEEDKQEHPNGLEQAYDSQLARISSRPVPLCGLEQDDRNRVVQNRLPEDYGVQLWVHLICVENGQDCNRVGSAERCAYTEGFDEADIQTFKWDPRPEP